MNVSTQTHCKFSSVRCESQRDEHAPHHLVEREWFADAFESAAIHAIAEASSVSRLVTKATALTNRVRR
jgi:hypothetical protein